MGREMHLEQMPEEIKTAIEGLDNESRQRIFISLLKYGELSFSELEKRTCLSKPDLSFHMRKLVNAMLVEHYYRHEIGNDQFSFYSATPFGYNLFNALVQSLTPSVPSIETNEIESVNVTIDNARTTTKKVVLPVATSSERRQLVTMK